MIEEACSVQVTLVGGHLDGDTVLLTPAGSLGPPNFLGYVGATEKDGAGFYVYTCGLDALAVWPKEPMRLKYYFDRFHPLFPKN